MEDLKQIQEFFSKPIKENSRRSPDFILTEPAEIKYTESFGSGIKAPGVLHHANEGVFLGAEGAYIIVLPGGTFYVDEDKEEAIRIYPLKDQSRELQLALDYTPFSPKYETWKSWVKKPKTLEGAYSGFRRGEPEDLDSEPFNPTGAVAEFKEDLRALFSKFKGDLKNPEFIKGVGEIMVSWKSLLRSQLEEYNTGIYYKDEKTQDKAKDSAKTAMDRVKDMIKKIASEQIEESKPKKGHGEKIAKDVFAKLQGKVVNYKGEEYKVVSSDDAVLRMQDGDGNFKSVNLNQFNIGGMIKEIMETIELGKNLNEELCAKGKAYRKKRMAAGEKSSAYLSGRAVKVCKGQMKG
jgi:hypothetical protein